LPPDAVPEGEVGPVAGAETLSAGDSPVRPDGPRAVRAQTEENTMQRVSSVALVLSLALAGSAWSDSREGSEKKETRDPLPQSKQLRWDVRGFEESPSFTVVKRQVKGNQVTWVLENKRGLGTEIIFGYQAALYDEDGVKLATIEVGTEPFLLNMSQGERNRFTLNLPPEDKLRGVRKVVIKNGAN
jgi:hypothetical protein